jgi:hypothetical protein
MGSRRTFPPVGPTCPPWGSRSFGYCCPIHETRILVSGSATRKQGGQDILENWATVSVLEQKTTILWKYLYLLVSLKDSAGLGVTYETKRRSEEENPVHRQNTTVNVDKIRGFRPPYVWMKTFGYCWRTPINGISIT